MIMGKEIITAENGLCTHTNISYLLGHRIALPIQNSK
jgi:hypothetical protein